MRKAQISLEVILAIGLCVMIFIGFLVFYINKRSDIGELDKILNLRDECFKFSNAIESAIALGPGYTAHLTTKNTIGINDGVITIESSEGTDVTCNYLGDVISGNYTNKINITNKDNLIIIQNV